MDSRSCESQIFQRTSRSTSSSNSRNRDSVCPTTGTKYSRRISRGRARKLTICFKWTWVSRGSVVPHRHEPLKINLGLQFTCSRRTIKVGVVVTIFRSCMIQRSGNPWRVGAKVRVHLEMMWEVLGGHHSRSRMSSSSSNNRDLCYKQIRRHGQRIGGGRVIIWISNRIIKSSNCLGTRTWIASKSQMPVVEMPPIHLRLTPDLSSLRRFRLGKEQLTSRDSLRLGHLRHIRSPEWRKVICFYKRGEVRS